jgi:hypothetical protein
MWRVNGSPHIGMWLFPQAPGDFYFSLASSETVERQSGGFLTLYLFESAARRLQVIQMPLQGTYLQAKVI